MTLGWGCTFCSRSNCEIDNVGASSRSPAVHIEAPHAMIKDTTVCARLWQWHRHRHSPRRRCNVRRRPPRCHKFLCDWQHGSGRNHDSRGIQHHDLELEHRGGCCMHSGRAWSCSSLSPAPAQNNRQLHALFSSPVWLRYKVLFGFCNLSESLAGVPWRITASSRGKLHWRLGSRWHKNHQQRRRMVRRRWHLCSSFT